jgi:glycosyltransferase involved in cell wall biosynthesis
MIDKFKTFDKWPLSESVNRIGEGGNRFKYDKKTSHKNQPLITIITVTYNGEKHIEETFRSVFDQTYDNYEYIVIDGGSSDQTLKIIRKYEDKIDYWVSEKDLGIYDAFNKGMQLCQGDYLGFINSDDVYEKNTLETLVKYIKTNSDVDFIFGSVKKHWGILHGYKPWKIFYSWGFYSSHSTVFFIKTDSAKKVGLYNLKYRYSSDYDYFFRMIVGHKMKGVSTKKNELFGTFRRGGFSSTIKFFDHFLEEIKIRLDNNQNRFLVLCIFIYKFIKNIGKI